MDLDQDGALHLKKGPNNKAEKIVVGHFLIKTAQYHIYIFTCSLSSKRLKPIKGVFLFFKIIIIIKD